LVVEVVGHLLDEVGLGSSSSGGGGGVEVRGRDVGRVVVGVVRILVVEERERGGGRRKVWERRLCLMSCRDAVWRSWVPVFVVLSKVGRVGLLQGMRMVRI